MDIYQIWARESANHTAPKWLVDAWDDDSVSGNREGYDAALAKARLENGAENIVVIVQAVNMDLVDAAFDPIRIPAEAEASAERWKQMYINEARCRDSVVMRRTQGDRILAKLRRLALESDDVVQVHDVIKILGELDIAGDRLVETAAHAVANTVLPKPYTGEQLARAQATAALAAVGHKVEISTIEQRDALPVGSALLDPQGICVKYYGYWARANAVGEWNPTLPAELIHYGDGPILAAGSQL